MTKVMTPNLKELGKLIPADGQYHRVVYHFVDHDTHLLFIDGVLVHTDEPLSRSHLATIFEVEEEEITADETQPFILQKWIPGE